ncbi:hypothetical protein GCWU000325_00305 [Alloprevotella tannerae ATCC 51259]|uniref:Uncharacterized protein n=1 Tax=Alloprevotella tannerae ATCC 51259 TaxID=626522 RepID=C9LDN2_9BACT|nr:hypothetical protein GCWU000325_00305 [Alloprevotella tannerae ATCC 51259]
MNCHTFDYLRSEDNAFAHCEHARSSEKMFIAHFFSRGNSIGCCKCTLRHFRKGRLPTNAITAAMRDRPFASRHSS